MTAIAGSPRPDRLTFLALAALCAVAFAGVSWVTADSEALRPDTASYMFFEPSRPIGYPLFLWLASLLGGPLLAVPIQMLLLTLSLFLLGWTFYRWSGRPALAVLLQLALLVSPEMWKFSAFLITEAIATALAALWCVLVLRGLKAPSLRSVALLALVAGVATLVKPGLVPLFLGTGIMALALGGLRSRVLGVATTGAGLALTLIATPVANFLIHGSSDGGSPAARGVLQHTLFCEPSTLPTDPDSLLVEREARIVRDYIASAPPGAKGYLQRLYTGKLRFGRIIPLLGQRHGLAAGWKTDELVWRITRERIAANPGCYVRSVLGSYFAMATYDSYSSREAKRLQQVLAAHPPVDVPALPLLPEDAELAERAAQAVGADPRLPGRQVFEAPTGRPLLLTWAARLLYGTAAVLGIVGMLLWVWPRKAKWRTEDVQLVTGMAALGIAFHGVIALTAIVELALTRYTVAVWPIVCTLIAIVGAWLFEWVWRRWQVSRQGRPAPLPAGLTARPDPRSAP